MSDAKSRRRRTTAPIMVGWNELVDLPDWSVKGIRAKIDTGARSSSLHVEQVKWLSTDRVSFIISVGKQARTQAQTPVEAEVVRFSRVKSSNGHYNHRIFVSTAMKLGDHIQEVEINLVDRGDMQFPMLVGRTALAGHYIVDPAHRRLLSPAPKKKRKEKNS